MRKIAINNQKLESKDIETLKRDAMLPLSQQRRRLR